MGGSAPTAAGSPPVDPEVGGAAGAALLRRRAAPQPRGRGARAAAAGAGDHRHQLRGATDRRPAGRHAVHRRRADRGDRAAGGALVRRRPAGGRGAVADRHPLPEPDRRARHRAPVRGRHERAAGQGHRVLPRELRRVADQAGAELRQPVRGVRGHPDLRGAGQPGAAAVRLRRALALRPAAGRGADRDAGGQRRADHAADPAPAAAGRPAGGGDRAGRPGTSRTA